MNSSALDYCLRAVAHLKMESPEDGTVAVVLPHSDSPVVHPLGHGLMVVYLVDEGDHFTWVQNRHLNESGFSEEELHEQALRNLVAFAEKQTEVRAYGNIYVVLAGGNFEASMLLLNEFWSEWFANLAPNGFVAAFPARDILAFGDAASDEAISELWAVCERVKGEVNHPLSPVLYQRISGCWEPLGGSQETPPKRLICI